MPSRAIFAHSHGPKSNPDKMQFWKKSLALGLALSQTCDAYSINAVAVSPQPAITSRSELQMQFGLLKKAPPTKQGGIGSFFKKAPPQKNGPQLPGGLELPELPQLPAIPGLPEQLFEPGKGFVLPFGIGYLPLWGASLTPGFLAAVYILVASNGPGPLLLEQGTVILADNAPEVALQLPLDAKNKAKAEKIIAKKAEIAAEAERLRIAAEIEAAKSPEQKAAEAKAAAEAAAAKKAEEEAAAKIAEEAKIKAAQEAEAAKKAAELKAAQEAENKIKTRDARIRRGGASKEEVADYYTERDTKAAAKRAELKEKLQTAAAKK